MSGTYQALAEKLNRLDLTSEPLKDVSMARLEAVEGILGVQGDPTVAAPARMTAALKAVDALVELVSAPLDPSGTLESMHDHLRRQGAARTQLARLEIVLNEASSYGMHL